MLHGGRQSTTVGALGLGARNLTMYTDRMLACVVKKAWDVRDRIRQLCGVVADMLGKLDITCRRNTQGGRPQRLVKIMPPRCER